MTKQEAVNWFNLMSVSMPMVTITYESVGDITALLGQSEYQTADYETNAIVQVISKDFICLYSDLPSEPDRGDNIVLEQDGITYTYEVIDPVFREVDPYKAIARVHTKLVGMA